MMGIQGDVMLDPTPTHHATIDKRIMLNVEWCLSDAMQPGMHYIGIPQKRRCVEKKATQGGAFPRELGLIFLCILCFYMQHTQR